MDAPTEASVKSSIGAVVMDEEHLAHGVRYVALNLVRVRLVERAENWAWPSVRAHLAEKEDGLVTIWPVLERYGDFAGFLGTPADYTESWRTLRKAETTGRPIGARGWVAKIERLTGRTLMPQKRGPKVGI